MAQQRPAALTTICIVGIVLGVLSSCVACWGAVGFAMSARMQDELRTVRQQMGTSPDPAFTEMERMQDEMLAMQAEQMPWLLALSGAGVLVALLVLTAASLTLAGRPPGPSLLLIACAIAIPFEVLRGAIETWLQLRNHEVMQGYMGRVMASSGQPAPPEMDTVMSSFVGASAALGICIAVGWILLKIAYYAISIAYLRRPEVKALFPAQASVAGREG